MGNKKFREYLSYRDIKSTELEISQNLSISISLIGKNTTKAPGLCSSVANMEIDFKCSRKLNSDIVEWIEENNFYIFFNREYLSIIAKLKYPLIRGDGIVLLYGVGVKELEEFDHNEYEILVREIFQEVHTHFEKVYKEVCPNSIRFILG